MLKFDNYQVFFKHLPEEWGFVTWTELDGTREMQTPYKGTTVCTITKDDEVISTGDSFCGVGDRFDKAVGRKVALSRALWNLKDKEFSRFVWEKYLATSRR